MALIRDKGNHVRKMLSIAVIALQLLACQGGSSGDVSSQQINALTASVREAHDYARSATEPLFRQMVGLEKKVRLLEDEITFLTSKSADSFLTDGSANHRYRVVSIFGPNQVLVEVGTNLRAIYEAARVDQVTLDPVPPASPWSAGAWFSGAGCTGTAYFEAKEIGLVFPIDASYAIEVPSDSQRIDNVGVLSRYTNTYGCEAFVADIPNVWTATLVPVSKYRLFTPLKIVQ